MREAAEHVADQPTGPALRPSFGDEVRPLGAVPPESRYWPLLTAAVIALITAASLWWSHDHKYPLNWDEAAYIGQVQMDVAQLHANGLRGLVKAWLREDTARPPAYRILAFPFAAVFGASPFLLRAVAILFRVLTFWLIYLGVRRLGSRGSAALAAIFAALGPDVVFFGTLFYNEYTLYLATAGICCFLLRSWNQASGSIANCLGLGIFLGLGALAKSSFPALAGCLLLIVAFLSWRRKVAGPSPQFLLNACVVGALIAAPWWLFNCREALHYVRYAMNFSRYASGPPGLRASAAYAFHFLQEGFGLPLGCWGAFVLLFCGLRRLRGEARQPLAEANLAALCALLAPLPTCLLPLRAPNQVIYHLSHSMIPFAVGFGLLAQSQGWMRSMPRLIVLNAVIFIQLALILAPVVSRAKHPGGPGDLSAWTALARWEQWDWDPFRLFLRSHGLQRPPIAILGGCSTLDPPQVAYPWLAHQEVGPEVTWLWRQEQGPADLAALISAANTNVVVVTVPDLTAADWNCDEPDNQYNTEFAGRLGRGGVFQEPAHLRLGRFHPVDVWVFIRSGHREP